MPSSARETMMYQSTSYAEALPQVMSILSDAVLNPRITDQELDEQRDAIAWEIREIKNKPEVYLPEVLHEAAFDGTLGNPLLCPEDRIDTLRADTIRQWHKMWYKPERLVVAAAGVEHDDFVDIANRHFADVRSSSVANHPSVVRSLKAAAKQQAHVKNLSTSAPNHASVLETESNVITGEPYEDSFEYLSTAKPKYVGGERFIYDPDSEFTHFLVAYEGLRIDDPDIYTLATIQILLGGGGSFSAGGPGKGMYSRLYTNVLNQHHAVDHCSSFHHVYVDTSLFGLTISVHASFVPQISTLVAHQLDSITRPIMRGGITHVELERAKNQLKSSLAMTLETRSTQVEDLGRQVQVHGHKIPLETMCAAIDRVTIQDVHRVATRVLRPSESSLLEDRHTRSGRPTIVAMGKLDRLGDVRKVLARRDLAGRNTQA